MRESSSAAAAVWQADLAEYWPLFVSPAESAQTKIKQERVKNIGMKKNEESLGKGISESIEGKFPKERFASTNDLSIRNWDSGVPEFCCVLVKEKKGGIFFMMASAFENF